MEGQADGRAVGRKVCRMEESADRRAGGWKGAQTVGLVEKGLADGRASERASDHKSCRTKGTGR